MATPNVQTDAMGNFGMAPGATPAPVAPVEPQAVTDARANPLYIGSTNFGNLQKQYTPYQIEQATTRDAAGNIFWKQGAEISKIPAAPPKFAAPTVAPTPSTNNLQTTTTAPVETITTPTPVTAQDQFAAGQSEAAKTYLTGIQSTLDGLLAKQQAMETAAKTAAQAQVDATKGKISAMADSTAAQDTLKATRDMFQVTQTITALNEVRTRIADATAALDQGIIHEESQPVRMQLLTGRASALKKQGLAHLGALQATSEILKGNIELAQAYASDSIAAIKVDNDQRRTALTTLLNLENDNLIKLSAEEKSTIDSRMKLLENESSRIDKQKDEIMNLATNYPLAFTQGSVLLTDTPEQAIAKMASFMSEEQKLDLEQKRLELSKTKAEIAKTNRTGTGGGTSTTGTPLTEEIADVIANLQSQNFSQTDIRAAIYKMYGGKFKKQTELASILDNILQGTQTPNTPVEEQRNRVLLKQQDLENKGVLKLDVLTGLYTRSSNGADIEAAANAGEITWTGEGWMDKYKNNIPDPSTISYTKNRWFGDDVKY